MNTVNNITRLVSEIESLHDNTGKIIDACGHDPFSDSPAALEFQSFPMSGPLDVSYSQGSILIEVVADQLMSFVRSITQPVLTISPWTSVRAMLEASALSVWLLSTVINSHERVSRSYALRLEGMKQQLKFARSIKDEIGFELVQERIKKFQSDAESLGYESYINEKGEIVWIGQNLPSSTELIRDNLDEESAYRLLSAMVHGHSLALQQLGFQRREAEERLFLKKSIEPMAIYYLSQRAIRSFYFPIRKKFELFGWDTLGIYDRFESLLNLVADFASNADYPFDKRNNQSA